MTQTDRSGNEIFGAAYKAGRGAGVPTGQAEQMARMLSVCAADDVLTAFIGQLEKAAVPSQVAINGDHVVFDNAHFFRDGPLAIDALSSGMASATLRPMDICPCVQNFSRVYGIAVTSDDQGGAVFTSAGLAQDHTPKRAMLSDDLWDQLNAWAYKTYVPETAESRLSGAGAGLTDND